VLSPTVNFGIQLTKHTVIDSPGTTLVHFRSNTSSRVPMVYWTPQIWYNRPGGNRWQLRSGCAVDGGGQFGWCSGRVILFRVKHILMEARLSEYRARKRKEAAKQSVYNMLTFNSQQHVRGNERNVPVPALQEVNVLLSQFS
jgi:hypothetical protein